MNRSFSTVKPRGGYELSWNERQWGIYDISSIACKNPLRSLAEIGNFSLLSKQIKITSETNYYSWATYIGWNGRTLQTTNQASQTLNADIVMYTTYMDFTAALTSHLTVRILDGREVVCVSGWIPAWDADLAVVWPSGPSCWPSAPNRRFNKPPCDWEPAHGTSTGPLSSLKQTQPLTPRHTTHNMQSGQTHSLAAPSSNCLRWDN